MVSLCVFEMVVLLVSQQQFYETVTRQEEYEMDTYMNYSERRKIDVSKYIEKKGKFNYLSWAWAVDQLLQLDPMATWDYKEPTYYHDQTMMVYCSVTAFGKTMTAQLPVMDNYNKPIVEPSSMQVNTGMQRCLAKAIALHGLGLYIYQGEDLPDLDAQDFIDKLNACQNLDELTAAFKEVYPAIKTQPNILKLVTAVKDQLKVKFTKDAADVQRLGVAGAVEAAMAEKQDAGASEDIH